MEIKEDGRGNFTILKYIIIGANMDKLKWYIADKDYVNYLRRYESKVENINYKDKLKPYIGILIKIDECNYYVPISSVKTKHNEMKEGIDFIKIIKDNKLIA